jgi:hypothetical protein
MGRLGRLAGRYVRLANKLKSLIPYYLNIFSDKEKPGLYKHRAGG